MRPPFYSQTAQNHGEYDLETSKYDLETNVDDKCYYIWVGC